MPKDRFSQKSLLDYAGFLASGQEAPTQPRRSSSGTRGTTRRTSSTGRGDGNCPPVGGIPVTIYASNDIRNAKGDLTMSEQRSRLLNASATPRTVTTTGPASNGGWRGNPSVYWMSREQRVEDNWALIRAAELAKKNAVPLLVVFSLTRTFPEATSRTYDFMLRGLQEVEAQLHRLSIPFAVLRPTARRPRPGAEVMDDLSVGACVGEFVEAISGSTLVTDFSPMKVRTIWNADVNRVVKCPFIEVDAHNIVPVWETSSVEEEAAKTIRPKIVDKLPRFLVEYPKVEDLLSSTPGDGVKKQKVVPGDIGSGEACQVRPSGVGAASLGATTELDEAYKFLRSVGGAVEGVDVVLPERDAAVWQSLREWVTPSSGSGQSTVAGPLGAAKDAVPIPTSLMPPGPAAALSQMRGFLKPGGNHSKYNVSRNDPTTPVSSCLSSYLHYGHISAQRVALELIKLKNPKSNAEPPAAADVQLCPKPAPSGDQFLDQLIVRKDLADNYCYYNSNYDNHAGLPAWSRATLQKHRDDAKEYLYSCDQFELAQTHDPLWNAAQNELTELGLIHPYMRMYWCKKILEWCRTPEEAHLIGNYLNDKYSLDGRDPNGYVGVAWCIGGLHDGAMPQESDKGFGKVRWMSYNGCKKKFNVTLYQQTVDQRAKSVAGPLKDMPPSSKQNPSTMQKGEPLTVGASVQSACRDRQPDGSTVSSAIDVDAASDPGVVDDRNGLAATGFSHAPAVKSAKKLKKSRLQ